jgi:hypothetical protein
MNQAASWSTYGQQQAQQWAGLGGRKLLGTNSNTNNNNNNSNNNNNNNNNNNDDDDNNDNDDNDDNCEWVSSPSCATVNTALLL